MTHEFGPLLTETMDFGKDVHGRPYDLVEVLRLWSENAKDQGSQLAVEGLDAAADEIERLRFERDGFLEGNRQTLAALAEANEIAKRYKAERDEARRLFCKLDAEMYGHFGDNDRLVVHRASYFPSDAAKKRGWDCFKEER